MLPAIVAAADGPSIAQNCGILHQEPYALAGNVQVEDVALQNTDDGLVMTGAETAASYNPIEERTI